MWKKDHKPSKMKNLFKGFRKSTTDLSEWSKNDEKLIKYTENKDISKIDDLLKKKSLNPTKLGPKGLSVFHVACLQGSMEVVVLLIAHGAEVNVLSIQGYTSVQLAAREGHSHIIDRLIEAGGVVDHKDGSSLTALHYACANDKLSCVQVLLKHRADPNSQDKTGRPPLFYAAYKGNLPICKELVDKGANVNACDEHQLTPLIAAAKQGNSEICEFLLRKGADPKLCDKQGHNALAHGIAAGFLHLRAVFSKVPTLAPQWTGNKKDNVFGNDVPVVTEEKVTKVVEKVVENAVVPEVCHPVREYNSNTEGPQEELDEEILAERAASPPKSVIDQRAQEALKELEEENEHRNQELKQIIAANKQLQESNNTLKKQLCSPAPPPVDPEEVRELEDELSALKSQLNEEQDKNIRLTEKIKKLKKFKLQSDNTFKCDEDSCNDSDGEDIFDMSKLSKGTRKTTVIVDHKPQTLLLLQNQVVQLRQDNKHLRERLQTGNVSSLSSIDDVPEIDKMRRQLEEMETERQRLLKMQENNVFSEEQVQNLQVLEQENAKLQADVKQLRTELNLLKFNKDTEKPSGLINENINGIQGDNIENAIPLKTFVNFEQSTINMKLQEMESVHKESNVLKSENMVLTKELEVLTETYNKLVIAGDNLQDMYDQLVLDKEKTLEDYEDVVKAKQDLAKESEDLLADSNAMQEDIERLVTEVEKLNDQNQNLVREKEELETKISALSQLNSGTASEVARVQEERDKLQEERDKLLEKVDRLEKVSEELKQNQDSVLEEIQSVQASLQRAEYEKDEVQQNFYSLQDEFENLHGSHDCLQQDYTQLERDYSELLADKEKLEQEFLEVQTASVNLENHNPAMSEERDKLIQDNETLIMENDQLEMTIKELSKSNALLNEELTNLKEALLLDKNINKVYVNEGKKQNDTKDSKSANSKEFLSKSDIDAIVEKDRQIRSLQIQISRLQQQFIDSNYHNHEAINTYRSHLLSAVQGRMDPKIKQALYSILELRSTVQQC